MAAFGVWGEDTQVLPYEKHNSGSLRKVALHPLLDVEAPYLGAFFAENALEYGFRLSRPDHPEAPANLMVRIAHVVSFVSLAAP